MLRFASKRLFGIASPEPPFPAAASQLLPRSYHERVVDHYNNPRNVGSFEKDDPNVGTGLVGAPACGDVMKLQIKVDEETGKIVDARFKTFGCGSAIASSSVGYELKITMVCYPWDSPLFLSTEWVKGKQMEDVLSIKNTEIAKHLSLPPVKLHCSMLAEDAIKAAVKDYEARRAKEKCNGGASSGEKASTV
ncbi:iron-sulfur cluster assembly protein 1-like [Senna tora]|uniref:Iron-sulfur cluster assembly protein 1-like n=1 Tax=Senna tora TaxID=362788 RepID=A0A834X4V2_9FABA|nr:iron-sulfur cluster assembly protein 1-like [Senna tora]